MSKKCIIFAYTKGNKTMKKNITITRETSLEILNNLGKEILDEMKQDFPLLRDVLIRTCGPVHIMVVFSFIYTFKKKEIINYIEEKYNLEYRYKEVDVYNQTDDFIFYL
jgi:hypothetical protein